MRIAITGGIGCGKSFVCQQLKDYYGIEVYDCDANAKRIMANDQQLQQRISDAVGCDVFPGGVINKAALSQFLLASPDNNKIINSIVHPAVADDFIKSRFNWMESAILFEAGFQKYVDCILCVSAPREVRIQRIIQRDNISRQQAIAWIDRQMPQEEKERLSDFVIINDGTTPLTPQFESITYNGQSLRKQLL